MTWTTLPVSERVSEGGVFEGTAFALSGPEDAPVVVLIHGLGLCRAVFDGILPDLAGFRVLRYDLWGHGASAPSPLRAASLGGFSDQIVALLDHLGVREAHLVGFSIGGMINRRFALDHPDRVASLVILNSPHDRGAALQAEVEARAKAVQGQGAMATMEAALQRWFTAPHQAGPLAEQVVAWRGRVDPESYASAAWVLAHGVRELIGQPMALPALVMTSQEDSGSTPAMSEAIAAEIAGAACVIAPGLKHLGLMEAPGVFAKPIREFLDRQSYSVFRKT